MFRKMGLLVSSSSIMRVALLGVSLKTLAWWISSGSVSSRSVVMALPQGSSWSMVLRLAASISFSSNTVLEVFGT